MNAGRIKEFYKAPTLDQIIPYKTSKYLSTHSGPQSPLARRKVCRVFTRVLFRSTSNMVFDSMPDDSTVCQVNELRTIFSRYIWDEDWDRLRATCDQLHPFLLNVKDRTGWTLFMFLCADPRAGTRVIQYLFDRPDFNQSDINPNIQDNSGNTALHQACNFNQIDTVRIIMDLPSINANIRNNFGTTPLHRAVDKNYGGVVTQLLKKMIRDEIEVRNERGLNAVEVAFANGNEGLAYYIIDILRRKLTTPGQ